MACSLPPLPRSMLVDWLADLLFLYSSWYSNIGDRLMSWDFIYIVRRLYHGDNNWGEMYIKNDKGKWEWLSYSYELPWVEDKQGKSKSEISRIRIGEYPATVRTDGKPRVLGGKGWRLELKNTGHRKYVQIHRASASMYIKGCILPVHFNDVSGENIRKGDIRILNKSVEIMEKIEEYYNRIYNNKNGDPVIVISARLPPIQVTNKSYVYG